MKIKFDVQSYSKQGNKHSYQLIPSKTVDPNEVSPLVNFEGSLSLHLSNESAIDPRKTYEIEVKPVE